MSLALPGLPTARSEGYRRDMRPKTFFVLLIIVAAYILGARAGRERYDQIVDSLTAFWNSPDVKKARKNAEKQTAKARKKYS